MNINATLLAQTINFFIAYLVLRTLLLRPALAVIEQEVADQELLDQKIQSKEEVIASLESDRTKQRLASHYFFKQHRPDVTDRDRYLFMHITPPVPYPTYDSEQVNKLRTTISNKLLMTLRRYHARI